MQAFNRNLEGWFDKIRSGQLRLPRFQRNEAWERGNIVAVLDSVVRDLPIGSALILEMGDTEAFVSRPLGGAPDPTERCTEHLLDGQQRLTALWKAFNGLYRDAAFFVDLNANSAVENDGGSRIIGFSRWASADGGTLPKWLDDPQSVYARSLVPVSLIKPSENSVDRQAWCDAAVNNDLRASRQLDNTIRELQDRVRRFNLPMLLLESGTSRQTALDVFIRVNTKNEPLTAMDLVVAQLEAKTGLSFAELVERLEERCPSVRRFGDSDQHVLQAALLRADKPPSQSYMFDLDLDQLADRWSSLIDGVKWAIDLLESENIFGEQWLPTVVVIPVLTALHQYLPVDPKAREQAESVVREYIWRAFVSGRYEYSSTSKALRDFRVMRDEFQGNADRPRREIFDPLVCTVASVDEVIRAGSPKRRDTLARSIVLLTLKAGVNVVDGSRITRSDLETWDYQPIVPESLAAKSGGSRSGDGSNAINCFVMAPVARSPQSNGGFIPLSAYLVNGQPDLPVFEDRIRSHLVPLPELRELIRLSNEEGVDKREWAQCYAAFLERRAGLIHEQMIKAISA